MVTSSYGYCTDCHEHHELSDVRGPGTCTRHKIGRQEHSAIMREIGSPEDNEEYGCQEHSEIMREILGH